MLLKRGNQNGHGWQIRKRCHSAACGFASHAGTLPPIGAFPDTTGMSSCTCDCQGFVLGSVVAGRVGGGGRPSGGPAVPCVAGSDAGGGWVNGAGCDAGRPGTGVVGGT